MAAYKKLSDLEIRYSEHKGAKDKQVAHSERGIN